MTNPDLRMRAHQRMGIKEYEALTDVERAVSDARHFFAVIIGDEHMAGDGGSRQTHSLYQLKGPKVGKIRFDLEKAIYEGRIRYEGSPASDLRFLKKTAETAKEVITFSGEVEAAESEARSAASVDAASRWPEDKERGREARQWGDCLSIALDVIENVSGERPSSEWWELTPEALAMALEDLDAENPGIDLSGVIGSLGAHDIGAAWLALYNFVEVRRRA
jgi:hypothetical protein